jgi:hypothetical protein
MFGLRSVRSIDPYKYRPSMVFGLGPIFSFSFASFTVTDRRHFQSESVNWRIFFGFDPFMSSARDALRRLKFSVAGPVKIQKNRIKTRLIRVETEAGKKEWGNEHY